MRVLIADDEPLVRFSLRSMIEELDLPLTVVAEVSNGEELVQAVKLYLPEITFVDIRMPGVNGLQAIRRVRKTGARTRWIILTSHAEFDYASEAIQLGVEAYVLKPAGPGQLRSALAPLVEDISREWADDNSRFTQSLRGGLEIPSHWPGQPTFLVCWAGVLQLDFEASLTSLTRTSLKESTMEALRALLSPSGRHWMVAVWAVEATTLRLVMAARDGGVEELVGPWQDGVMAFIKQEVEGLKLSGAGVAGVATWNDLAEAFERSTQMLAYRGVLGTGTFRDVEGWNRRVASLSDPVAALGVAVDGFLGAWERGRGPDMLELSERLVERLATLAGTWEVVARYLSYRTGIAAPQDEKPPEWADRFLSTVRSSVPEVRKAVDAQVRIVEGIDSYLIQHLLDEVRVPDIATVLSLSPNYLSSIYRKVAGTTISGRLTELRLNRARELLSVPGNAVKTVAMEVGYKSTRHFARLYHERFGHYPSGR